MRRPDHALATPSTAMLLGTGLLAMTILMLQVVLIRIFSVTMWYHFAFMSISLALLGAAVGGVAVYLFPRLFPVQPGRSEGRAAIAAALFSLAMILSVRIHLAMPFVDTNLGLWQMAWLYLDLALPFFLGGLGMTLLLSVYPAHVSRVYFADLLGAGAGCLLAIPALAAFGGPGAVLAVAAIAMLAALCLGVAAGWGRLRRLLTGAGVVGLVGLLLLNSSLQFLSIEYARGRAEQDMEVEAWNSFSRVSVSREISVPGRGQPMSWALSPTFRGRNPGSRNLRIDRDAGTPISRFDGQNLEPLSFLKYDLSAMAYRIQPADAGPVLIIGPGGGRDILTARLFGRQEITAVELNPLIVDLVNNRYGDYSGRPYYLPGVRAVVGNARSFLAHAPADERYGLIQATLVDTWAAASAGAFVLSENFLYTREAFTDYYRHLTDDGMVTMSRFYYRGQPSESLRLILMAMAAWSDMGVAEPELCVAMVTVDNPDDPMGLATLIAKRTPFTPAEVASLKQQTAELGFKLAYAPGEPPANDDLGKAMQLRGAERQAFIDSYFLNIRPSTDDSPFFFNLIRPRDFLLGSSVAGQVLPNHMEAGRLLFRLLLIVFGLCLLTVIGPLALVVLRGQEAGLAARRRTGQLFLGYAACLGLGFMLIETVLMQRFILFLGQPVYALAVILFALLIFSGLGSWLTSKVAPERLAWVQVAVLGGVVAAVVVYAVGLPLVLWALLGMPEMGRVVASVVLLAPLGLLLGMPFPLGVRLANERKDSPLIPWAWAINGAMSVLASVGSVTLALARGFTWVLLLAAIVYALALALAAWPLLSRRAADQPAYRITAAPATE